jgi:hypothetical protein
MNRDKHISVKGNFGIFLKKSKENYVFVLIGVGSTHIFLLDNIGKYITSICNTERRKIVRERREVVLIVVLAEGKKGDGDPSNDNMFLGRYN